MGQAVWLSMPGPPRGKLGPQPPGGRCCSSGICQQSAPAGRCEEGGRRAACPPPWPRPPPVRRHPLRSAPPTRPAAAAAAAARRPCPCVNNRRRSCNPGRHCSTASMPEAHCFAEAAPSRAAHLMCCSSCPTCAAWRLMALSRSARAPFISASSASRAATCLSARSSRACTPSSCTCGMRRFGGG